MNPQMGTGIVHHVLSESEFKKHAVLRIRFDRQLALIHHNHPTSSRKWAVCRYLLPAFSTLNVDVFTANKPRGLQAARKLRTDRRDNRWVGIMRLMTVDNS